MNFTGKKIAIIGANEYQNRLILKAKELGIETHVFSWGGGEAGELNADNFYQVDVTKRQEIFEKCKLLKVDGVCSIASDLTNLTVNYIREKLGHIKNSNDCLELTTNKYLMREALKAGGSPIPYYQIAKKNQNLIELCHFPYIVKPIDRSGSRGVNLVHNFDQLQKAVKESIEESFLSESIIEEFIEGDEYSIESYSKNGSHFILQITKKYTTGAPRFIERAHLAPAFIDSKLQKAVKESIEESFLSESIIEEFIEGDEYSIESYSKNGSHFILQITKKYTTGAPRFIERAHLAPAFIDSKLEEKIKQVVSKALTNLKVEFGSSHSEIKINEAGEIKIIEIGSRMGGDFIGSDLVIQNTKVDFLRLEIMNALGQDVSDSELSGDKEIESIISVIFSFDEKHYNQVQELFCYKIIDTAVNENYSGNVLSSSERYGYHIIKVPNSEIMKIKQVCQ